MITTDSETKRIVMEAAKEADDLVFDSDADFETITSNRMITFMKTVIEKRKETK